jgi:hypothetical protein
VLYETLCSAGGGRRQYFVTESPPPANDWLRASPETVLHELQFLFSIGVGPGSTRPRLRWGSWLCRNGEIRDKAEPQTLNI